ncbi:zf-HC2 domain-containing protein [Nocardia australiensis]|uniref:zf-HC2 domain-containing protein n=1 Tax=Nocardia australiensis TaxID=2887191 RepID=UPI001D158E98|nr:zf-HC2 domain-containing protein [Nocardia australiensis]
MSGDSNTSGRRFHGARGNANSRQPRFRPTEHLASEAVAAYVDGELRMNAYLRAAQHLAACPECAAEVDAQQQARIALRRSGQISIPTSLHDSLTRIPLAELPGTTTSPSPPTSHGTPRNEPVFGFLTDSFTATRWTTWWRK